MLVRHGRTGWNLEGRAQGQADVSIDDVGRAQAKETAAALAGLSPARLWTSDLARARETAAFLEEATGLVAEPDPALREYAVGVRSGLTHPEFAERFPAEYAAWESRQDGPRVEGEESTAAVRARLVPALASYLGSLGPGETGVAVTHGACLKVGVAGLLGWPDEQYRDLVGIENGGWVVVAQRERDHRARLEAYNRTAG